MADPTENKQIPSKGLDPLGTKSFGMDKAVQHLYKGQLVMLDATGYLVKAASTLGCRFCGVAIDEKEQAAAAAADGTNEIKVATRGAHKLTVTSVAVTNIGDPVFITDSGACQLTPTEVFIGWVEKYVTTNTAYVTLCGDYQPRRFEIILSIPESSASSSLYSGLWTATRACKILLANANAFQWPDYATSVIDVDKYDLGTTADKAVVAATDIDNKTDKTAIALTLTSTGADLLLAAGDSVYALQTLGATEVHVSKGLAVTLEMEEYGRPNA